MKSEGFPRCRSCKWWGKDYLGCCAFTETVHAADTDARFEAQARGELEVRVHTGPDFGCVHHDPILTDAELDARIYTTIQNVLGLMDRQVLMPRNAPTTEEWTMIARLLKESSDILFSRHAKKK